MNESKNRPDRRLLIVGTGGLAREAAQAAAYENQSRRRWGRIELVGENPSVVGSRVGGWLVTECDESLRTVSQGVDVLLGIGTPAIRHRIAATLADIDHIHFVNLVSSRAVLDQNRVSLGFGTIVMPGCQFTCDIQVGDHCYFNLNVTVGHDTVIHSHVMVNPGANISGRVVVGEGVLIGTGAQILERRTIGQGAVVGAGAVVVHDVPPGVTVVGVPARNLRVVDG
ncbi:MAG: NeuD/PglB/VioB family sugar acetyltransferase [Deltaproteobacteria bacterium]|nr:NeuD/PglB/VioB family sugar acetyltransferase [Deltaproteobacteria bacterium]